MEYEKNAFLVLEMLKQYDLPINKTPDNKHTSVVRAWANLNQKNTNVEIALTFFVTRRNKLLISLSRVGWYFGNSLSIINFAIESTPDYAIT